MEATEEAALVRHPCSKDRLIVKGGVVEREDGEEKISGEGKMIYNTSTHAHTDGTEMCRLMRAKKGVKLKGKEREDVVVR